MAGLTVRWGASLPRGSADEKVRSASVAKPVPLARRQWAFLVCAPLAVNIKSGLPSSTASLTGTGCFE